MLKDLEGYVLGAVASGAVSGYAVRLRLDSEVGPVWSADSGSVYRVIKRLSDSGLLQESGKAGFIKRERTEYGVTREGHQAFVTWMRSSLNPRLVTPDALAVRIGFIHLFAEQERIGLLKLWIHDNHAQLRQLDRHIRGESRTVRRWQLQNIAEHHRARDRWLHSIVKELSETAQREIETTA